MLPDLPELRNKITSAYELMQSNSVEEFKAVDEEINHYIPYYAQQITYSSTTTASMNMMQFSTIILQSLKIIGVLVVSLGVAFGLFHASFLADVISTVLIAGISGFLALYVWKKIPRLRSLWKANDVIDLHNINLHNNLSQSIIALDYIKGYHYNTFHKIQEWQTNGMWKTEDESTEMENSPPTLSNILEKIKEQQK